MGSNPAVLTLTCLRTRLRAGFFMIANALLRAAHQLRATGGDYIDLSDTSFHRNSLRFPDDLLARYFADYLKTRSYDPDPRGLPAARDAIAAYVRSRAIACDASDVLLTASTSDAYSVIFQALLRAGDRVLLPRPCYPLFEYLCRYARLRMDYYDLDPDTGFAPDLVGLRRKLARPAAALVTISPNNPTGACLSSRDWQEMQSICAEHDLIMISDEVFDDLTWEEETQRVPERSPDSAPIMLRLGGVSKLFASPDLKLSWIALTQAAPDARARVLDALETCRDMYLNSSGPAEYLGARMLRDGVTYRTDLRNAVHARKLLCDRLLSACTSHAPGLRIYPQQGGIHRVIRLPCGYDDEATALRLLDETRVLVHPGYMYGFPEGAYWVMTCLPEESVLKNAIPRLVNFLESL